MVGNKTIVLAALASSAVAQTGGAITIMADNSLSGHGLTTAHIGAGQSIVKASDSAGDAVFFYNSSASMIQNVAIVSGFNLPCYVVNQPSYFAPTAGPLECGVTYNQSADYATASVDGNNVISYSGISSWWSCTVNTYTYGNMSTVIVGSWGSGTPSGPGIGSDCVTINSLQLAGSSNTTSSSAMPTATPTDQTPTYSNGTTTTTITYQLCNTCPVVTSVCGGSCPTASTTTTTDAAGSPSVMTYLGSNSPDSSAATATAIAPNAGGGSATTASPDSGSSNSGSNTINAASNGGTATPSPPAATASINAYQGGAEALQIRSSNSLFALAAVFVVFAVLF